MGDGKSIRRVDWLINTAWEESRVVCIDALLQDCWKSTFSAHGHCFWKLRLKLKDLS